MRLREQLAEQPGIEVKVKVEVKVEIQEKIDVVTQASKRFRIPVRKPCPVLHRMLCETQNGGQTAAALANHARQ